MHPRLPGADGRHQQWTVKGAGRDRYWPETLMVSGIFVLVISFWLAAERTLIPYGTLLRWFALFAFIGNLLPYGRIAGRLGFERLEWFLFNLLAVGPLLLSLLLWVNLLFHGPETLLVVPSGQVSHTVKRYWTEHEALPQGVPVEILQPDPAVAAEEVPGDLLGTATGCLGYDVVTRWEPLYGPP